MLAHVRERLLRTPQQYDLRVAVEHGQPGGAHGHVETRFSGEPRTEPVERVTDAAGVLSDGDIERIELALAQFERRFPQLFAAVYCGALPQPTSLRQFGFWLLNRAAISELDVTRANDHGAMFVIDTHGRSAALGLGYFLECYLDERDARAVLEAGRRFEDEDFPETSWDVRRYLWAPQVGCYGIQLSPTWYYPPNEAQIYDHFKAVATGIDLCVMVYHTPWLDSHMSMALLNRLWADFPNVRSLKWSSFSEHETMEGYIELAAKYAIIDNGSAVPHGALLGAQLHQLRDLVAARPAPARPEWTLPIRWLNCKS